MEGQIVCKKCGKVLPQEYAACPACGRRTKRSNGRLQFSLLGWIIATVFIGLCAVEYFGSGAVSTIFHGATATPTASPAPTLSASPSPTPAITPTLAPTVYNDTYSVYGLSAELSYTEFIYKYNQFKQGAYVPDKTKLNPDYRTNYLQSGDYGSVRSTTYNIDNNTTLQIWVIGKQLYVKKIYLHATLTDNKNDKSERILNECCLLTSVPYGTEFQYDYTSANVKTGKSFSETIGGIKFIYSKNNSNIQITIDLGG
jgi:hypothetical protein